MSRFVIGGTRIVTVLEHQIEKVVKKRLTPYEIDDIMIRRLQQQLDICIRSVSLIEEAAVKV